MVDDKYDDDDDDDDDDDEFSAKRSVSHGCRICKKTFKSQMQCVESSWSRELFA
jgi:hypothetical protein